MRWPIFFLLIYSLAGCGPKVPPIASGLPQNYKEGESVFNARVKKAFPSGTEEGRMIAELTAQGFTMLSSDRGQFATFSDKRFPIETVWHVGWNASEGQVTNVWGVHGGRGP